MVELKRVCGVAAFLCVAAVLWWGRMNPTPNHDLFNLRQSSSPSGLELWRDVPALPWTRCAWWTDIAAEPTLATKKTNGYIIVECSGGLNQMRRDLCKGVGIAQLLNATLLLPRFEASPYWNDTSRFADIFDANFFVESMQGWVQILAEIPAAMATQKPFPITCHKQKRPFDYMESLLPELLRHKFILLRPSANQRFDRFQVFAKNAQCQACYRALRLVGSLQKTAAHILRRIPRPFLALHLRFEPDMIAYSRCRYSNLSTLSAALVEEARGHRQALGEGSGRSWRRRGKCPLTPQETAFLLQALHIPTSATIYLAAGSELLDLQAFTSTYSHTIQKSDFLSANQLQNLRGSSRAAIDWFVCLRADAYIATFLGNMDKMVVADRILAGKQQNLVLNRRAFAEAKWEGKPDSEISKIMWEGHKQDVIGGHHLPLSECFCEGRRTSKP